MENILLKLKCQKNFQYRDEKFTPVKSFGNTNLRWNKERKVNPTNEIKENQSMIKMGTQNILYFSLKSLMIKTFFKRQMQGRNMHTWVWTSFFLSLTSTLLCTHTKKITPKQKRGNNGIGFYRPLQHQITSLSHSLQRKRPINDWRPYNTCLD